MTPSTLRILAWCVSLAVAAIATVAWGEAYAWRLSKLSLYQIFPLLGLLAFSLMWAHYVMAALRRHFGLGKSVLQSYFSVTSALVLSLLLLHPGLLAWQLAQDGAGLPPASEFRYVVASARWAILFGFIALTAFLLYEFRRIVRDKSWRRRIQYGSDVAMILIFLHALKLGGTLHLGWFRLIWLLYGAVFIGTLIYLHTSTEHDATAHEG